jgi:hypothetical protein
LGASGTSSSSIPRDRSGTRRLANAFAPDPPEPLHANRDKRLAQFALFKGRRGPRSLRRVQ